MWYLLLFRWRYILILCLRWHYNRNHIYFISVHIFVSCFTEYYSCVFPFQESTKRFHGRENQTYNILGAESKIPICVSVYITDNFTILKYIYVSMLHFWQLSRKNPEIQKFSISRITGGSSKTYISAH